MNLKAAKLTLYLDVLPPRRPMPSWPKSSAKVIKAEAQRKEAGEYLEDW